MNKTLRNLLLSFVCMIALLGSLRLANAAYSYHNSTTGTWNGITVYVQEGAEFKSSGWTYTGGTSHVQSGYAVYTSVTNAYTVASSILTPYLVREYTVGITAPSYVYGTVSGLRNSW